MGLGSASSTTPGPELDGPGIHCNSGWGGPSSLFANPPPLIGLSGLGPPNDLIHKFQESYLKCTAPYPLVVRGGCPFSMHPNQKCSGRLPNGCRRLLATCCYQGHKQVT